MYRYEKKESKFKYIMCTVLLMIIASVSTLFLYKMYLNINVHTVPLDLFLHYYTTKEL